MGLYISSVTFYNQKCNLIVRQGSNERDSSSPTERVSPVILSEAKDLSAERDRPFASLRVTRWDGCNGEGLFFTTEPCLISLIWLLQRYKWNTLDYQDYITLSLCCRWCIGLPVRRYPG